MVALIRYETILLARSYRWIPPVVLYLAIVGTSTAGNPPASDTFGYAGAALVPTAAWLTRVGVTAEPDPARACLITAAGAARAHVSALVVAGLGGVLLALLTAPVLLVAGGPDPATHRAPSSAAVLVTGLVAQLACILVGVAVGAACNPPVLRRAGVAVLTTGLLVVISLVLSFSPARAAISGALQAGSGGSAPPVIPLLAAAVLAAAAVAGASLVARRRGMVG